MSTPAFSLIYVLQIGMPQPVTFDGRKFSGGRRDIIGISPRTVFSRNVIYCGYLAIDVHTPGVYGYHLFRWGPVSRNGVFAVSSLNATLVMLVSVSFRLPEITSNWKISIKEGSTVVFLL